MLAYGHLLLIIFLFDCNVQEFEKNYRNIEITRLLPLGSVSSIAS